MYLQSIICHHSYQPAFHPPCTGQWPPLTMRHMCVCVWALLRQAVWFWFNSSCCPMESFPLPVFHQIWLSHFQMNTILDPRCSLRAEPCFAASHAFFIFNPSMLWVVLKNRGPQVHQIWGCLKDDLRWSLKVDEDGVVAMNAVRKLFKLTVTELFNFRYHIYRRIPHSEDLHCLFLLSLCSGNQCWEATVKL